MCSGPVGAGPFFKNRCTGSWSAFRPRENRRRGSDWSHSNRLSGRSSGRSKIPRTVYAFSRSRNSRERGGLNQFNRRGELFLRAIFQQIFQLGHEFFDVLEVQIDRSEPDIGDLVEFLDSVHQEFADLAGLTLALGRFMDKTLDFVDQGFELCRGDRPLLAGFQQPLQNFLAVEALPASVLLDDHVRDFVDAFVRGETAAAFQTFPAAANQVPDSALARVDNFVVREGTERALHLGEPPGSLTLKPRLGIDTPLGPVTPICLPTSSAAASARANFRSSPTDIPS